MSLIDSTDNVLMLGAYGWAFAKPIRKLYYNITITSVSWPSPGGGRRRGARAGGGQVPPDGPGVGSGLQLNDNFGLLGYGIVALFVVSWILSIAIYKWRRFDDLEFGARDAG